MTKSDSFQMDCFRRLADALETGDAVLATVVQTRGFVPREVGAKMIMRRDHIVYGTIGGGAGEAKVIRAAHDVLQTGAKLLVEIDLTSPQAEGICGGKMQVWLERWQGEKDFALTQKILENLEAGKNVVLVTPRTQNDSPYLLTENALAPIDAFVEVLEPPPILLIVGAGHVGIELAKIAELIGFQIVVQDDREEWAKPGNFSAAVKILTEPIAQAAARFENCEKLYAALVTRGYEYDLEALKTLLKRGLPCQYVGMIGSAKRVRQVFQELEKNGIAKEKLAAVHAPIGLDIGAKTPSEIAVSIAAELILTRHAGM